MALVHRREVLVADGYDYADAFEMSAGDVDARSAEDVLRAGLEGAPRWLRPIVAIAHRRVLALDLAPLSAPNHVAGWEIVDSDDDNITLRAGGPLLDGLLVARRTSPSSAVLETFVRYRRPVLASLIWTAVAPIHRAVVPILLRRAATVPVAR